MNALLPIDVTLLGIVMLVRSVHPKNAAPPISVTLLGSSNITLVNPVQPLNALLPILVTLLGIVIPVKPVKPMNAEAPILITLLGTMLELVAMISSLLDILITQLPSLR
jgi:hypothetical protein